MEIIMTFDDHFCCKYESIHAISARKWKKYRLSFFWNSSPRWNHHWVLQWRNDGTSHIDRDWIKKPTAKVRERFNKRRSRSRGTLAMNGLCKSTDPVVDFYSSSLSQKPNLESMTFKKHMVMSRQTQELIDNKRQKARELLDSHEIIRVSQCPTFNNKELHASWEMKWRRRRTRVQIEAQLQSVIKSTDGSWCAQIMSNGNKKKLRPWICYSLSVTLDRETSKHTKLLAQCRSDFYTRIDNEISESEFFDKEFQTRRKKYKRMENWM